MRRFLIAAVAALSVSGPAASAQTTNDNGNDRPQTAAETAAIAAMVAKLNSDTTAAKPVLAVTRQQLADTFQTCVAAGGTAAVIVACIRDAFVALKTQ